MDSLLRQKILLLLYGGIALGFTYSPARQMYIIKTLTREWRRLNRMKLRREIHNLYRSRLIKTQENKDGTFTFALSEKGKLKALTYHFKNMRIKSPKWDGRWRFVVFDIPERHRYERDVVRAKLRELGFYELQKSVFVLPYECRDEINFLVDFFQVRAFVRFGIFTEIDNEVHLRKIFGLL